jgi:hypothetical protein
VVSNGWQTHGHVKKTPSYAYRLDWAPSDGLRLYFSGHVGKESAIGEWNGDVRFYDELAAQMDFGKRVSAAVQLWGAKQGSSTAYGGVAWAKWAFMERLYVAVRGEYFHDGDGFLFEGLNAPLLPAVARASFGGSAGVSTFEAGTLTLGWTPHESFIVKLEGSYRHANDAAFYGDAAPVLSSTASASTLLTGPFATEKNSISTVLSAAFVY